MPDHIVNPDPVPIEPSLTNISAPTPTPSALQVFEKQVADEVAKRAADQFQKTFDHYKYGAAGASSPAFQVIQNHNKATHTKAEYAKALRDFIESEQKSTLAPLNPAAAPPPLFPTAFLTALPCAGALVIKDVEANLKTILHSHLEHAIARAIRAAIEDVNGQPEKAVEATKQTNRAELERLVKHLEDLHDTKGDHSSINVDEWIKIGVKYMKPHDRQRLVATGLVTFPSGRDEKGNEYAGASATKNFSEIKNIKLVSAISTAVAGTAIGGAILTVGGPIGFGFATVVALANWAYQTRLQVRHENVLERTLKEIRSELNKTKPDGCVAWAGLLYKFINEANPLWIYPNRTKVFGTAEATHVPAIRSHLASAAAVAISEEHGIESYLKGVNYKDHLNLANKALENLETRWNWWHEKQKLVAPALAVGCAAGTASLFTRTLGPLIP